MLTTTPIHSLSAQRKNFLNLYADVFWYGILSGSTISFLSVYAARLGASTVQMGLLTASAAGVNFLLSIHAGRWLQGRSLIQATFVSSLWHRAAYLLMILLPWFFKEATQVNLLVGLTLLMSIPGTVLAISFNALFAEIVPAERRAHVVGRRNTLLAISLAASTLLCGQLLEMIAYPLNYQIIFTLGAIGALMSSISLGRVRPVVQSQAPQSNGIPIQEVARPGLIRFPDTLRQPLGLRFLTRSAGKPLLRLDLLRGPFGPAFGVYLLFHIFQYVPVPIFPLYWVHELGLSEKAISLASAVFYVMMLLASLWFGKLSRQLGHRGLLIFSSSLYGLYPLLNGAARDAYLVWIASIVGGAVWALLNGSFSNRFMERVPQDDRPAHMALYNLVLNLGILSGSMLGPLLGEWFGLRNTLFISAALRLIATILLAMWG